MKIMYVLHERPLYPDDSREETRADGTNYINISIPVTKLSQASVSAEIHNQKRRRQVRPFDPKVYKNL
jgi:hypothetical protein